MGVKTTGLVAADPLRLHFHLHSRHGGWQAHLSAQFGLGGTGAAGVFRVQGTTSVTSALGATLGGIQLATGRCSDGRAGLSLGVV